MDRDIIDFPRVMIRPLTCDWDIDWRGQSAGEGASSEQIVFNRIPRFVGSPKVLLTAEMIPYFHALRAQAEGRKNAWRLPMLDPLGFEIERGGWRDDWAAYTSGYYVEDRPKILCAEATLAGAATVLVDERMARAPVKIGALLSYDDWPFRVTARAAEGVYTRLSVKLQRRAIPEGAEIDLEARGLFIATEDRMGNPEYDFQRRARPQLSFIEWITRS